MKIISWNILFDDESGTQRYPEILDYLEEQSVDVICLQEVTKSFIDVLSKHSLSKDFNIFHEKQEHWYRNIILAKSEVENEGIIELPTKLGRRAPYIVSEGVFIFSLHLESMPEDFNYRLEQLKTIQSFLETESYILCGDMNFGDQDREQNFVEDNFNDVGKSSGDLTYDIDRNKIAARTKFDNEVSRRLDRFLVGDDLKIDSYKMLTSPSSDHYPIYLEFRNN
jgi:endonuclease/exonuclease/phosphatase family metal-dependent hydrolase